SMNVWIIVGFGGQGTLLGPIVGSLILAPIPYLMQELYLYKDIVYGGLIVFTTIFLPRGVYGSFVFHRRARAAARLAAASRTQEAAS
ncbi:MAG TPA: hypothetical protein VFG28_08110, partial [Syntrophales bacterium]|nr:hypothetical protein [Syntrophales bacterium]